MHEQTTSIVQQYLDSLTGDAPDEAIIRALLDRSARRLHSLCANLLYRGYPRLTMPPLNFNADELLNAVVEELLKTLRKLRPHTSRQFFALSNQHMRWQLNNLARRLDEQPKVICLQDEMVLAPVSSGSGISPNARRMLEAIDNLPDDEREAFDLVRMQGLTQSEAAEILDVSSKTVQRRVNRARLLLAHAVSELCPKEKEVEE